MIQKLQTLFQLDHVAVVSIIGINISEKQWEFSTFYLIIDYRHCKMLVNVVAKFNNIINMVD